MGPLERYGLQPDPVIEYYKRDVDRTLLREHLKLTPTERLERLEGMIRMLDDAEWRIEGAHRARVIDALAYFAEPVDLIPDQVPGVGFLDDAIMVELVVQDIRPELDAYADFCRYREEQRRSGLAPEAHRKRLEARRRAMLARIDRRRARRLRQGGSLFSISDRSIAVPSAGGGPTPGY